MGSTVLAIDAGTHSVRCLAFDLETGCYQVCAAESLPLSMPHPGWVEIDPEVVAGATIRVVRSGLDWADSHGHTVATIGLANMRETAFAWRRSTQLPAYPGIMWMSAQSQPTVESWRAAGLDPLIRERTGLTNHSFFFGSKVAWLLAERPELASLAEQGDLAVGTLESWLLYRLSGGATHATDVSNGSRYQLMGLATLRWDEELCKALQVPRAALPTLLPTSAPFGTTHSAVCGTEIPITAMVADQQASLLGHGCDQPGDIKVTFGTSGVVSLNCGPQVVLRDGLVTSVAWTRPDGSVDYEVEGSAFHSGYTVDWILKRFGGAHSWSARMVESPMRATERTYVLPAFSELGAPRWPSGRGAIISGLGMDTTREDLIRAGVEAMAFQAYDLFLALALPEDASSGEVNVDGGGAANDYLCQLLADLVGREVVRPTTQEVTSVGAAKAAIIGLGLPVDRHFGQDRSAATRFHPRQDSSYANEGYQCWANLVERTLR